MRQVITNFVVYIHNLVKQAALALTDSSININMSILHKLCIVL